MSLTHAAVLGAKPQEKPYKLYDERGLFLLVKPNGARLWRFKYVHGGHRIDYFGYDHFQGISSYLGYFIVSIDQYVSGATAYWDLYVNGQPSAVGMDTYLVQPGDKVELKWLQVAAAGHSAGARAQRAHARRATRK